MWNNRNSNRNSGPRVSSDRFGNAYQLKLAAQKRDKKTGGLVDGVYQTYVELGGKLYQIEVSPANKESRDGRPGVWVKVTKKDQQKRATSM